MYTINFSGNTVSIFKGTNSFSRTLLANDLPKAKQLAFSSGARAVYNFINRVGK